jgi:hypothetical protein
MDRRKVALEHLRSLIPELRKLIEACAILGQGRLADKLANIKDHILLAIGQLEKEEEA